MKLLYIIKSIAKLGGLDRVWVERMNYLAESCSHDVYLLTYEQGNHPISYPLSTRIKHCDIGVRFFTLCKETIYKRVLTYYKMRRTFKKRLCFQIEKISPDVVICTTDAFPLLNIITKASKGCYRIIESHVAKCDFSKAPHFQNSSILHKLFTCFDHYIIKQIKACNKFIVLTQDDYEEWKNLIPQIEIIPNPVSFIPEKLSTLKEKRIISVGRLTYQKGFDMLISVWDIVYKKHSDWTLTIYGNGDDLKYLQNIIRTKGIKNIFIHEAVTDICNKYLESSIYVMSSRYEGFGLVLIEAMSCGLPCVSFDCPHGPKEIIIHNENGILTENGNIEKMAENICFLIENENERFKMGNKAKESTQRYQKKDIMKRWELLFNNIEKEYQL
ncbi:MAG: glycosyltransferase family 4 protein [Bacteroidaceae bacterium]|nr:glycosyltransferase family 4 protein [Bacteroidaceae bacterium]